MTGIHSTRGFRRAARANAPRIRRSERIVRLSILFGVLGAIFAAIAWWAMSTLDAAETPDERREQFLVSLISLAGAVFFFASIVYSAWALQRKWRRRRAAADLAISRGWHYNVEWDPRAYPATLFRTGGDAWVENAAHLHEPRYIEVGNYTFMTTQQASGRREVGFVGIGLDRRLPHMYLESTHRGAARAYVPPFDMADGRVLDFALRVAETLGSTTSRQSAHYADERSGDAAFIDASGARLRTGRWVAMAVPTLLAAAVWCGIAWANGLIRF